MQQAGEQIKYIKRSRRKQAINSLHISSFGMLNRNGLEIPSAMSIPAIEEDHAGKHPASAGGAMPEQQQGYIKCKKHDFF